MREVLFVSKPVAPPWNDSNKNLVRDVATALTRYRPRVLTPVGQPLDAPGVRSEPVYLRAGSFAPSKLDNAGVFARLLAGPRAALWHLFFSPNPLSLDLARGAARARRAPVVHTLCSAPDNLELVAKHLFADAVVALSQHTARRLRSAGVAAEVTVLPPAQRPVRVDAHDLRATVAAMGLAGQRYVLFPGDLEFGDGASAFVRAAAAGRDDGLRWVIAARDKTEAARRRRVALEDEARALRAPVVFFGTVPGIHPLVAGAEAVVLASNSLHAKMDWPLVLLEALWLGRPVLVARGTPCEDLLASEHATAVNAGAPEELLAQVRGLLARGDDERRARAERAALWLERTCAPSVVAAGYEALYDRVLEARASAGRRR